MNLHDHKRIKVLQSIQHRLDKVRPPRGIVSIIPWPEEEGGSLSNKFRLIIINGSVASSADNSLLANAHGTGLGWVYTRWCQGQVGGRDR
jgi:hypothetical protein